MTMPMPWPGTPEEEAANRDSHTYIYTGGPDDGDVRCTGCDCRPSYVSAGWPCGAEVPRVSYDEGARLEALTRRPGAR